MKTTDAPVTKYREDYQPPVFTINETHLNFQVFDDHTLVEAQLHLQKKVSGHVSEFTLDGEELELLSIAINKQPLQESGYQVSDSGLTLFEPSDEFVLTTKVKIKPAENTSLSGLYQSGEKLCTQCEAEGFRKITYYLDRPDVLAKFFVRIEANKQKFPLLLSNGNPLENGELSDGRHFANWQDPFPKPSYLFALVAGDLDLLEDSFVTCSGREVKLQLFVDKGKLDQSDFAMESLKNAMKWDEQRYNLEYDLDLYMIVAVSDFNMGAMENKGLNIFNTKYVLANQKTATDQDFENIESVIGHEYFHNWTGNRVTCRDWFQLSLKEGLTVFRDQQFTEDMRSKAVKRIDDVKVVRSYQFAEDAGPMAHPIRPDSYIEMNNFYTVTVYNKGAEVIRMLHTLLGEEGFQKGMALYVERHDGDAATCDDFVAAMADANDRSLESFKTWYSQAGTPQLSVRYEFDQTQNCVRIVFKQQNSHSSAVKPYLIPIKTGLINHKGDAISFTLGSSNEPQTETLLLIDQFEQTLELHQVKEPVVLSCLRDFSAPVKLIINYSNNDLAFLFAHDSNSFNRWDAGQELMQRFIASGDEECLQLILSSFEKIIGDTQMDNAFKARALSIPDHKTLFESHSELGVDRLIERRKALLESISNSLQSLWYNCYEQLSAISADSDEKTQVAARAMKNLALYYLANSQRCNTQMLVQQFESANNMTDELAAFSSSVLARTDKADEMTQKFYQRWHNEELVMDKWLSVQAQSTCDSTIDNIMKLENDPVFKFSNPNKVRALYATFAQLNFVQFHRNDGAGYQLVANCIKRLDKLNPQTAANITKAFSVVSKLDQKRTESIKKELLSIKAVKHLSKDVFEIVEKTLALINSKQGE